MPAVYLHLPFCRRRCRYCAFYSGEPLGQLPALVAGLGAEMALRAADLTGPVTSVYFGGGTPSLLSPDQVALLLDGVGRTWGRAGNAEVTLEVNPGDPLPLAALRGAGVTRLSVGVQSLDDAELAVLGRRHGAAQALAALDDARAAGFARLSADLILGLPGTAPAALARWVAELAARGVNHLSVYSLELHPGTALAADRAAGRFAPAGEALEDAQYRAVAEAAGRCGLAAYEVSNFAAAGQRCRHNCAYWQGEPYLGLGPGAHSYLPAAGPWGTRRWNAPGLEAYLGAVAAGRPPPDGAEALTRDEALLERLFLALRCRKPVSPRVLAAHFALEPAAVAAAFGDLAAAGLLEPLPGGRLRPAPSALRRADGLALALHRRLLPRA